MITCPYCNTVNQSGAAFCSRCGTMLDIHPAENTSPKKMLPQAAPRTLQPAIPVQPTVPSAHRTKPLGGKNHASALHSPDGADDFRPRPAGAIFGDRFVFDSLRYRDAAEIRYTVVEKSASGQPRYRICANPSCGALHPPAGDGLEQHCTQCGSPLLPSDILLLLQEARLPIFGAAVEIANRPGGLVHPNLRAPLAYFSETVCGEPRGCLVTPTYSAFPEHPEPALALAWGIQLARGLDYLHLNQLSFGGQIDPSCFGMDGTHPVWADFSQCNVPPEMVSQARTADTRALALQIFQWQSGKNEYGFEPGLPPPVNRFFREALNGKGFESGEALAQAIETAITDSTAQQSIGYRLGRCTNVGLERNLNEDSLASVEFSRVLQSISLPLGLFAVADGMGGHSAGEVASGTIANTITQRALTLNPLLPVSPEDALKWLKETVEAANRAVYDLRKKAGTDMGSTLVVALLDGVQATLANVGDSRIYRVSPQSIEQLTTDHSLVERLIASGQLSREEARYHPQRNVVYRTIGDKPNVEVETSIHTLAPGDHLLLCSDGLTGMIEDRIIQKLILDAPSPQEACERLISAANAAGGEDNITAIVIQIITV
jgi:serine/threonine protein phosphatase PrpC